MNVLGPIGSPEIFQSADVESQEDLGNQVTLRLAALYIALFMTLMISMCWIKVPDWCGQLNVTPTTEAISAQRSSGSDQMSPSSDFPPAKRRRTKSPTASSSDVGIEIDISI